MLIEFLLPQIFIKASSGSLKYMKHCYYVKIPKPVVNASERRPDIQGDICTTLGSHISLSLWKLPSQGGALSFRPPHNVCIPT